MVITTKAGKRKRGGITNKRMAKKRRLLRRLDSVGLQSTVRPAVKMYITVYLYTTVPVQGRLHLPYMKIYSIESRCLNYYENGDVLPNCDRMAVCRICTSKL